MLKLVDLIMGKKWAAIVVLFLIAALSVTGPAWVGYKVKTTIQKEIEPIRESLESLEDIQFHQVLNSGIAGYKKINGNIEKLESSTQNAAAVELALSIPKIRNILFAMDRENTILYEDYFKIN